MHQGKRQGLKIEVAEGWGGRRPVRVQIFGTSRQRPSGARARRRRRIGSTGRSSLQGVRVVGHAHALLPFDHPFLVTRP